MENIEFSECYKHLLSSQKIYLKLLHKDELTELGQIFRNHNEYIEAVWCYTEAIKRDPTRAFFYEMRGDCYERLKILDKAIEDYSQYMKFYPKAESTRRHMISLMFQSGKHEKALTEIQNWDDPDIAKLADYLRSKENYDGAILCYTKALEASPLDPEYYENRGRCHFELQNWNDALSDFQRLLQEKPPYNSNGLKYLIETLFRAGKSEEAVTAASAMDNYQLVTMVQKYLIDTKQYYEAAIHLLSLAINRDSSEASYYKMRSDCLQRTNDLKQAISDLQQALEIEPKNQNYCMALVEAFLNAGRLEEARKCMTHLDRERSKELLQLGVTLEDKDKFDEAVLCYSEVIEKERLIREGYQHRALCFRKMNKLEEAITDLKSLVETPSRFKSEDEFTLCEVLVEAGKYNEAKVALKNYEKSALPHCQEKAAALRSEIKRKEKEETESETNMKEDTNADLIDV